MQQQFNNQAHYIGYRKNANTGEFHGAVYRKPGQVIVYRCEDGWPTIGEAIDDVSSLFPQLSRPIAKTAKAA